MPRTLTALFLAAAGLAGHADALSPSDILPQLSLRQKIGQLTQLNIDQVLGDDNLPDPAKLARVFGNESGYFVGSIINTAFAGACGAWNVTQWTALLQTLQGYVLSQQGGVNPPVPLLFGLDSVHGANYVWNATLFPHNTGAAATFNPSLYFTQAAITAVETRAAGIPWMFSPVLGLGRNPQWSRLYETLGEEPFVGEAFASAYISGSLVGAASLVPGLNKSGTVLPIAATMKHYLAYSDPVNGHDRTDAWIPDAYLKQYFQPAFQAAVAAGAPTAMVNSASINGVPAHASRPLLTDLLRTELGFQGVAVSDWQDVEKLVLYHSLASTQAEAVQIALDAGLDMSMVPEDLSFADILLALVQNGTVPESRVDESVTRVLQLKIDLGLFSDPVTPPPLAGFQVGQDWAQAAALQAARESVTLLQNEPAPATGGVRPVLPLTAWLPAGANILVLGPAAVDRTALCGGWTTHWQGARNGGACAEELPPVGLSIGDAVAALAGAGGTPYTSTTFQGANFSSFDPAVVAQAAALAAKADVVILALGEAPESETPGSIPDLALDPAQQALFAAVAAAVAQPGSKNAPIVSVLVEPRPRILGPVAEGSAGLVMAYLPCVHGGQAIAEVLFGVTNPSGRLPITYPRAANDLDVAYHKTWNQNLEVDAFNGPEPWNPDAEPNLYHQPLFPFGHGLSFSEITYSGLSVSPASLPAGGVATVSLTVTNSGPLDANETVLVLVRQLFRPAITPEQRLLKAFTKVTVKNGESVPVTIPIDTSSFFYWSPTLDKAVDAGVYTIFVGNLTATLTLTEGGRFDFSPEAAAAARSLPLGRPRPSPWRLVLDSEPRAVAGTAAAAGDVDAAVEAVLDEVFNGGGGEGSRRGVPLRAEGAVARSVAEADLRARLRERLRGM